MIKNSRKRFSLLEKLIHSDEIKAIARGKSPHPFTRNRKLTFKDIILMSLNRKGLSTPMEIYQYYKKEGKLDMKISKQDYFKQRLKLNPEVFLALNTTYLSEFYNDAPLCLKGYHLFAIDGSKAEVPNSKENAKMFGIAENGKSCTTVRALISVGYDILNGFLLDLQIGNLSSSEPEMVKRNLQMMKDICKIR